MVGSLEEAIQEELDRVVGDGAIGRVSNQCSLLKVPKRISAAAVVLDVSFKESWLPPQQTRPRVEESPCGAPFSRSWGSTMIGRSDFWAGGADVDPDECLILKQGFHEQ